MSSQQLLKKINNHGQVKVVNIAYVWTIDNFCMRLQASSPKCWTSPVFSFETFSEIKWQLRLLPNDAHLSLYLDRVSGPDKFGAKFKFSIYDRLGEQWHKVTNAHVYTIQNPTAGVDKFVASAELQRTQKIFLPNGSLRILCLVSTEIDRSSQNGSSDDKQKDEINDSEEQLKVAMDMKALLNSPAFSDINFLVFGKEFHAHKCILATRCPQFLGVLMNRIGSDQESSKVRYNPKYELTDVDPQDMLEILRFIYCGKVENLKSHALNLLCASETYCVNRLKDLCEDYLCENINVDNAAYFFMYAFRYRALKLKKIALKYIIEHRTEIMKTKGYEIMSDKCPKLIDEIYRAAALGIKC